MIHLWLTGKSGIKQYNIVVDGNSLSAAYVSDSWPTILSQMPEFENSTVTNVAVSGQSTIVMLSDVATQVDPLYDPSKTNIYVAWEIRNHLVANQASVAYAIDRFKALCLGRKAIGWKVVAITVLPSYNGNYKGDPTINGYHQLDSDRLACNEQLRLNDGNYWDALCDVALDNRIGDLGDNENAGYVYSSTTSPTTSANGYFNDGTHFTSAGRQLLAGLVKDTIIANF